MIPVNPGNLLPFYLTPYSANDRRWQRHRQLGTDVVPFGLPCPRTRLMPFQLRFDGSALAVTAFALINPEDDTETITLSTSLLEIVSDATQFWVTWKADADLNVIPDCGYWYVYINIAGLGAAGRVVSEVLYLQDMCGFEQVGMEVRADSCEEGAGNISFILDAAITAGSGSTYTIERFNGLLWIEIADNASVTVTETLASESRDYRIIVTTPCGIITTKEYTAAWDAGDGCGTLAFTLEDTDVDESAILGTNPVWRLNFGNTTDKAKVLYQDGYEQYLYLPLVVWDVPEVNRETEIAIDGEGNEIKRFTRTVERRGFETADLPDYVLGWLSKAGDLDTIKLEDAKLLDAAAQAELSIENLTFETPGRQGVGLNIGRFYFDVESEAFQGCQDDYTLLT